MMTIRKANERGHADHGWLDTYHTFSFAGYYDPAHMGFRALRVINDDKVAPGAGFDMHPHRDMEIVTYVLKGALEHRDSMGNGRVIHPGEFQYMAAGTGVLHSEFNPSRKEGTHLLQIWILPDRKKAPPHYAEKAMTNAPTGRLHLITSKSGRERSIQINQDADLYLGRLKEGERVRHELGPDRHAWIHLASGAARVNGQELKAGDGAAVSGEKELVLEGGAAEVLVFDLN